MQFRNILWISFLLLGYGCASIVAPTGGPKDENAPELKRSNPLPLSKNFKGKKIILEFNEFVQLKNPGEQPVISPALEENPSIVVKEKQISIEFKTELKQNTTYTIQFGNNIVDLNESNVLEDFRFVFSTGNEIDSGSYQVRSYHILDNSISENLVLALYESLDSIHKKPEYSTKFKNNGIANLNNIPVKEFYIVSFDDINKNFIPDEEELIGYSTEKISSLDSFQIDIPIMLDQRAEIKKAINAFRDSVIYKVAFKEFKRSPENINIKYQSIKIEKDTLLLFTENKTSYNQFIYSYDYNQEIDTLKILNKKNIHQCKIEIKNLIEADQAIKLFSNCPLPKDIIINNIQVVKNSNEIKIDSINRINDFELNLHFNKEEETEYSLQISNFNKDNNYWKYNDTIDLKTKTKASTQTANLTFKIINTRETKYIIQFLNKDYQLKYEFQTNSDIEINKKYMDPDTYFIRIIQDKNGDGMWNSSDIKNRIQNEEIRFYDRTLELRANWDVNDVILNITQLFDNQ